MRRITGFHRIISRHLSTATSSGDPQTQKLHRIADELLSLTKPELEDYTILLRHKLGFTNLISSSDISSISVSSSSSDSSAAVEEEKKEEKTAFDVKLEKFEAGAKIKVIKEVRAFTDLGLKEAKELVEKAPVVVKKGVVKEEAEGIVKKLLEIGAKATLE